MPVKKGQKSDRPWEVEFVWCELDKSDKEALKKWDVSGQQTLQVIERLVSDGYKLTVWSDNAHDCYGASVTSPRGDGSTKQQCLSGRGPEFIDALRSVAYKHAILLDGDWAKRGEWEAGRDAWG